ncbi:DUF2071 domain-containing protein [Aquimarina sp. RZ0]|uniref:DUF2071 domain-containing protein n=1 Tax=Aquimarina sp. RZ0 TaxID=2607730 RepID=UPI0011F0B131|nr:DUF2071 domain-containing protein [Aquimarina sp. RZ0]KAA1242407.1 hypothetical protein F0000_25730 [Aquimarina sp. RZ0]
MTIKEILTTTAHRTWEIAYDDLVQFIPKELKIDLYKGKSWVSLVAITMHKIRRKNLTYFPDLSIEKLTYPRFHTLINKVPNKVHYSKVAKVIAWDKKSRSKYVYE